MTAVEDVLSTLREGGRAWELDRPCDQVMPAPRIGDSRPAPRRDVTAVEVVRVKAMGEAWQGLHRATIVLGIDPAGGMVEWRTTRPVSIGDRFTITIEPAR